MSYKKVILDLRCCVCHRNMTNGIAPIEALKRKLLQAIESDDFVHRDLV